MKSLSTMTRALFACSATAAVLSGCAEPAPSQEATNYSTSTTTPAAVDVSTRFDKTIFSEIRPQDTTNLTCFSVTSIYVGGEGHGDIECIEGQSQSAQAGQTARVAFQATIGKSHLFTVYPVTRPDIECRVMTSGFSGGEGGGHLSCTRRTTSPAP